MEAVFHTLVNVTTVSPLAVAALHACGGVAQLLPLLHHTNTSVQSWTVTVFAACVTARAPMIDKDVAANVVAATAAGAGAGAGKGRAAAAAGTPTAGGGKGGRGAGGTAAGGGPTPGTSALVAQTPLPDVSDAHGMLRSLRCVHCVGG